MKDDPDLGKLTQVIAIAAIAIREHTEQQKNEFEWRKSHSYLATKQDLQEWKCDMAIKLSELKNEVAGVRAQVQKIWTEQQAKYDALQKEFDTLKASLDDVELPPEVVQDLTDFKAQLQAFDDTIPDMTA